MFDKSFKVHGYAYNTAYSQRPNEILRKTK